MAGKVAVDKMIAEKTVLKDSDALDLYEWACSRVDKNYSKTIGALRARLVKASPANKDSAKTSFYACVANEDWENAQQVRMQKYLTNSGHTDSCN
jgi:N-terminal acetyltransferase B complex non-catalytic subunit